MNIALFGMDYETTKKLKDFVIMDSVGTIAHMTSQRGDRHSLLITGFNGHLEVVNKGLFINGKFGLKMSNFEGFSMYD